MSYYRYSKRRFGKVDYVGCDELFPEHVIIISEINYLDILYLNVFSSCGSCEWEFKVYPPGPCPNCKCEDYESRKMMFTVTYANTDVYKVNDIYLDIAVSERILRGVKH